jgi:glutamate synthase domain-containing protein 3
VLDLNLITLREANNSLQNSPDNNKWVIKNPKGSHALAVGLNKELLVEIKGSVGYYCGGMNKFSTIVVDGSAGPGLAENIMSGKVLIKGNASQYVGASGHGGLIIIEGNASSRCGISMKGVDIIVKGNVGHMSAFMAQAGNLVICGDAGDALGDSIYEANIFVYGKIKSLGADCIEKELTNTHKNVLTKLLREANFNNYKVENFKRYGSSRKLYNFKVDNSVNY